jgi:shikimate kinase
MIIYLVGYMGSGKSSAGRKLAGKMHFRFIDMDEAFRQKYGFTVSESLDREGEEVFREKEAELLREMPLNEYLVVATGGGTPCFHDNMDYMNDNGLTVYLKMHHKSLFRRLTEAKTERPLLKGLKGKQLLSFIRQHLEEREVFYNQAKIIVKGENLDVGYLAEHLDAEQKARG